MNKINESGRSMVEMLGVLAVMGVLSVGGVAMYTSAMNKYRANEILNEASKRAVMVAGQLFTNPNAPTMPLSQFGSNAVAGATFGKNASIANGKITLTISGVESAVCTQMKAATGTNSVMTITGECGSALTLTFASDMSKGGGSSSGSSTPSEDGYLSDDGSTCIADTKLGGDSGCQVCVQGLYVDSDAKCGSGKVCVDGTCSPNPLSGSGCAKNSDCKDQTDSDGNDCGSNGCYCNYNGKVSCSGPTGKGICVAKTKDYGAEVTVDGHKYVASCYRSETFDWWSAKNFCQSYGKRMMNLSELGCEDGVNCMTEGTKFYAINSAVMNSGEEDVSYGANTWTTTLGSGNSCSAWNVGSDGEVYSGVSRNNGYDALCR